ncbi:MAG: hypothetical protein IJ381_08370 [Clostridia bacterium]|nr:hypothetical protein [Clostridia bacterium]MBQ7982641.1 hypothetical protein [Clostridia bacterium]
MNVTVPRIAGIRTAVEIYYTYNDLSTKDVQRLFRCSASKARELKKPVQALMRERGILQKTECCIDTETAYEVWGIEIAMLEKKLQRAEKLGICREASE